MKSFALPLGIVLVVVAAVTSGVVLNSYNAPEGTVLGMAIEVNEHRVGNTEAKVQLIEYGDFQCPACASFDPILKRLMEENSDWINFSYRHFPLKEIHKNALKAAYASEAASNQGKFWEYKELLYSNQAEWASMFDPMAKFVEYANNLSLDEDKFISDVESSEVRIKVDSDYKTGLASGFNSTPTLVVNGRVVANPPTYEQLVELLKNENIVE
ncbi:MAG: DsbA family protein [Candidatus Doudnabacteria bacterium]|nr:DsbA family protein [Candidatus Doudnabacteria bacterium]